MDMSSEPNFTKPAARDVVTEGHTAAALAAYRQATLKSPANKTRGKASRRVPSLQVNLSPAGGAVHPAFMSRCGATKHHALLINRAVVRQVQAMEAHNGYEIRVALPGVRPGDKTTAAASLLYVRRPQAASS